MIICSCAVRVCDGKERCDVQNAVDKARLHRQQTNKPSLSNTHTDIEHAVGMFYVDHKKDTGQKPCRGCQSNVRDEVQKILSGQLCQGGAVSNTLEVA
jgi:hypothetical protein